MRLILILFLFAGAANVSAQSSRYELDGETLNFDMTIEKPGHEFTGQLEMYDEMWIRWHIENHLKIETLRLTGPGGVMLAARQLANMLSEYEINTVAYGECESACSALFIGGKTRTLEEGAKLGFHQTRLDKKDAMRDYERYKERKGWEDAFDYFIWATDDFTRQKIDDIKFMEKQGVSSDFIVKIFSTKNTDMWRPTREELLAGGVITQ